MTNDIVRLFQSFRAILCICPCCGDIVRLSDLRLKYKGAASRTWLDAYDHRTRQLENKELAFEEKEQRLRDRAIERGRRKVPRMICKCLDEDIAAFKYNPYDIARAALYHPVDFVVFNGLNREKELTDITFLSKRTTNQMLNKIRKSLKIAVEKENYDWRVARVSIEGKVEFE